MFPDRYIFKGSWQRGTIGYSFTGISNILPHNSVRYDFRNHLAGFRWHYPGAVHQAQIISKFMPNQTSVEISVQP